MDLKNTDEKEAYANFFKTFGLRIDENGNILAEVKLAEKDRVMANAVINYILRQLNNDSFIGVLDYEKYRRVLIESVRGLFKLIYIENLDYSDKKNRLSELVRCDIVFASSSNLMQILFTRVYKGADRETLHRKIDATKQVIMQK